MYSFNKLKCLHVCALIYFLLFVFIKITKPTLSPLYIVSHDQGFQEVMWISLVMVFELLTMTTTYPKSYSFLMAVGYMCKTTLIHSKLRLLYMSKPLIHLHQKHVSYIVVVDSSQLGFVRPIQVICDVKKIMYILHSIFIG